MLVVADLHLEKGSAYARRGTMLPPYDTHATLGRLERLVAAACGRGIVVSLGDGFHDRRGRRGAGPGGACSGCAPDRGRALALGGGQP